MMFGTGYQRTSFEPITRASHALKSRVEETGGKEELIQEQTDKEASMSMLTRRLFLQSAKQLQLSGARGFAAPGKGKGGGANAIVEEAVDLAKFVPTNIFKEGSHAELKDPSEYPEWLFKLLDVQPTLGELERSGFDNLELEQQRRMLTLANRRLVKSNNAAKSKK